MTNPMQPFHSMGLCTTRGHSPLYWHVHVIQLLKLKQTDYCPGKWNQSNALAQAQTHTLENLLYICTSGVDRVLINVTCDQVHAGDVSAWPLVGPDCPSLLIPPNHNNPNGLWWAPPSCLSNWWKFYTVLQPAPPSLLLLFFPLHIVQVKG